MKHYTFFFAGLTTYALINDVGEPICTSDEILTYWDAIGCGGLIALIWCLGFFYRTE